MPRRSHGGRWALTPPFHPCRVPCGPRRYLFCGTVCRATLSGDAPACIPGHAGVTRPRALWSSDFPPVAMPRATFRPSGTGTDYREARPSQEDSLCREGAGTDWGFNRERVVDRLCP